MKKIFYFLLVATLFSNCVSYDSLFYFRTEDVSRPSGLSEEIKNLAPLTIQTNDVLTITIHTFDPQLSAPFNLGTGVPNGNTVTAASASPLITYLVDESGNIDFPVLGKISVRGKTVNEAKALMQNKLKEYLIDPVINMRIANFRVSVLGEVRKPGTFFVNTDRLTVIEAIGLAGDLTNYSNRTNILVVRESGGVRTFGELNLRTVDIFKSDYYYLKQGDIVYIEPTKAKNGAIRDQANEATPWISTAIQAISVTLTAIVLLTR